MHYVAVYSFHICIFCIIVFLQLKYSNVVVCIAALLYIHADKGGPGIYRKHGGFFSTYLG